MRAFVAAAALLVWSSAAHADPRADAIASILPGESVRLQTTSGVAQGTFVTNRSDSLLLRRQAERVSLSYSDIHRVEVRRPATSLGLVIGMIVGGVATGAVVAANGTTPFLGAAVGTFFGGFLGSSIGSACSRWDRVYEAADTAATRH